MNRYVNKFVFAVLLLALGARPALGKEATLTQSEIKDGWVLLFDGESLFGLSQEGPLSWRISDGALFADGSGSGYIRTASPFSDFVLKMDIRLPNSSAEAALYLRTAKDGFPTDNGYQIPLGDGNSNWPAGSVVPRFKAKAAHPQAGQWHSLEITADGERVTILLDRVTVVEAKDSSVRAGYIGIKVGAGAVLEARNIKLKPINTIALFNGSDLAGWKTVAPPPPVEKSSKLKKIFPFGGKPKIKESVWAVQSGTIHGEKGPGELDTVATYDDFILQFAVPTSAKKQEGRRTIYVRSDAGKIFTGYEIAMGQDRPGAIAPNLANPRKIVSVKDLAVGTVAVSGRHVEVWVNGVPVTEFNDTRPEGASTTQNARTSAGAIGLPLHDSSGTADYTQIRLTTVARNLGGIIGKPPPPAPAPAMATGTTPAGVAPVIAINPEARQEAENRKKTAKMMSDALKSSDPAEQMRLYDQVIQLDPTNSGAAAGYKEAKEKLDRQAEEAQKQNVLQTQQQQNQSAGEGALHKAQIAFFAGDLTTADSQLALAERLAPSNPVVRELRQKINAVRSQNSRLRYLFFGGGLLAFGGLSTLFCLRLRKKHGFLQVMSGIENGRRYNLDQEVVRIGAVAQDGSERNDIIVRDIEHMISRFHCEIHHNNGKFYLVDCNSANGTQIDKKLVPPGEPQRLRRGARVDLAGTVTLNFGMERRRKKQAS